MTEKEVFEKIAELIAEIMETEIEIKPESRLTEDIGLISIGYVELVVEMEEAFSISFPDDMLTNNNLITVQDIVDNVMKLL